MNSHVHRFYRKFADEQAPSFFALWTPMQHAGNAYYSPIENALSDVQNRSTWQENLAFSTFLDWLIFYLESIA